MLSPTYYAACVLLCRWLEEELARRYRDAAPATLALLQERCEGVASDLVAAEAQLQAAEDVTSLRRAGQEILQSACHQHKAMAKRTSMQTMEYAMATYNYILLNGDLTIVPCYNTFAHQLVARHEQLKFHVAAWAVYTQIVHVAFDIAIIVT